MTLADLRTLTKKLLIYDLDGYLGGSPADADLDKVINQALRSIGSRLFLYGQVALTTVNGTQAYGLESASFAKRMLSIDRVTINGVPLKEYHGRLGIYHNLGQLEADFPTWNTLAAGTPTAAIVLGQSLHLVPKPNAAFANSSVRGQHLPADLSTGTDVPEIPVALHELIAYLAAFILATPTATEAEQFEKLKAFREQDVDLIEVHRARQMSDVFGGAR